MDGLNQSVVMSGMSSQRLGLSCILCQEMSALSDPKILTCLHLACQGCLEQHLSAVQTSSVGSMYINGFSEVIFSCPRCSFKTQLPKTGVSGLRSAEFLLNRDENGMTIVCEAEADKSEISINGNNLVSEPTNGISSDVVSGLHRQHSMAVQSENHGQPASDLRARKLKNAIERATDECDASVNLLETARLNLVDTQASLRESIERRAEYLCQLILARRDHLLADVQKHCKFSESQFISTLNALGRQAENLDYCSVFSDAVIRSDISDVDTVLEEASVRVAQISSSVSDCSRRRGHNILEVSSFRLAVPDSALDELHVDKLFGTIAGGKIGNTELIMSFNTELRWPSAFVTMRSRNSVLAGKTGAFADSGRLIFYDRHGVCMDSFTLEAGRLPVDLVTVFDGCILMSDSSGRISKYSSSGHFETEWLDMFRGTSGRMSVGTGRHGVETVIVTSVQDGVLRRYRTSDGHLVNEFALQWTDSSAKLEASAVSTNSAGEIIVAVSSACTLYVFSYDGIPLHCFRLPWNRPGSSRAVDIVDMDDKRASHLPSAVCCDPFDNVLVADFIANCIHLLSRTGRYLGQLLSEKDGISCPNFVSLDHDGRLYVGQYGGEVLVFQYLNFTKNV